jgi:hypothetical protein
MQEHSTQFATEATTGAVWVIAHCHRGLCSRLLLLSFLMHHFSRMYHDDERIWNWNSLTGNRKSSNRVANGVEVASTRPWLVIPRRLRPSGMQNGPIRHAAEEMFLGLARSNFFQSARKRVWVMTQRPSIACAWLRRSYATQARKPGTQQSAERVGVERGHQRALWRLFWAPSPQNPKTRFRRPPAPQIWESVT